MTSELKNAIITGADGGMGYEETKAVAQAGYRIIMASYDPKVAEPRRQSLIAETGNQNIEIVPIDLSQLDSVHHFVEEVKQRFTHLDLLMNNAGTLETQLRTTKDGLERTACINYVAPVLLTTLLLPLMDKGSRIVSMTSCAHVIGKLTFPEFFKQGCKGRFQRFRAYGNSKMALTIFSLMLAERVREQGITVNVADPGLVNTQIITLHNCLDHLSNLFFRPFIRTPKQGAQMAISLLLDADKAGQTGGFWRSGKQIKLRKAYRNEALRQRLWEETETFIAHPLP